MQRLTIAFPPEKENPVFLNHPRPHQLKQKVILNLSLIFTL